MHIYFSKLPVPFCSVLRRPRRVRSRVPAMRLTTTHKHIKVLSGSVRLDRRNALEVKASIRFREQEEKAMRRNSLMHQITHTFMGRSSFSGRLASGRSSFSQGDDALALRRPVRV